MLAAVLTAASLSSCTKDGIESFRGSYGYSMSGYISCEDPDGNTADFTVSKEIGTMHIEPKGDAAILTMDTVGGDVLVFDANVDGDQITISPIERLLSIEPRDSSITARKTIPVSMGGHGSKTNGLIVLSIEFGCDPFTMNYMEEGSVVSREYTISSCNVNCIANFRD